MDSIFCLIMKWAINLFRGLAPLAASLAFVSIGVAQSPTVVTEHDGTRSSVREAIVGDALLNEGAYRALETMTNRFGARMAGTDGNSASMDWLQSKLTELGLETEREAFDYVGWRRGDDKVTVVAPFERELRSVALGYVDAGPPVEAELASLNADAVENFSPERLAGKIILLPPNMRLSPQQQRDLSSLFGVVGVLATNRKNGGQLLARTTSHTGAVSPFPQFSIAQEEGLWLERLLASGETVKVRLEVSARTEPMVSENLIARIPGRSGRRIVVGAHFDSWDLGQGAMDNGIGVAQLYEMARLLNRHHPDNLHSIEFVWFNAEELGLWGSKAYTDRHNLDSVHVMINFDMAGNPIQLNAMGFSELIPVLERAEAHLGNWSFDEPVTSKTWLGSDHHPFIVKGVPAVTFNAPIDDEAVKFYHDFADTFDKIDPRMLTEGSAVYALVLLGLANDDTVLPHYPKDRIVRLFQDAGLEQRMRASESWPFE
jgi:hypothetical protein